MSAIISAALATVVLAAGPALAQEGDKAFTSDHLIAN